MKRLYSIFSILFVCTSALAENAMDNKNVVYHTTPSTTRRLKAEAAAAALAASNDSIVAVSPAALVPASKPSGVSAGSLYSKCMFSMGLTQVIFKDAFIKDDAENGLFDITFEGGKYIRDNIAWSVGLRFFERTQNNIDGASSTWHAKSDHILVPVHINYVIPSPAKGFLSWGGSLFEISAGGYIGSLVKYKYETYISKDNHNEYDLADMKKMDDDFKTFRYGFDWSIKFHCFSICRDYMFAPNNDKVSKITYICFSMSL